jgi:hypothetical protein
MILFGLVHAALLEGFDVAEQFIEDFLGES